MTTDPPASPRDPRAGAGLQIAVALVGYAGLLLVVDFFAGAHAYSRLHPLTELLGEARRQAVASLASEAGLLERTALSGPLLLMALILLRLPRHREPFAGLGLAGGWATFRHVFSGLLTGVAMHLLLLVLLASLAIGDWTKAPVGALLLARQMVGNAVEFARLLPFWLLMPLMLPTGYALGRLVVSHGHLCGELDELGPRWAVDGAVAVVFVAPYLLIDAITPLAAVNLLLMGLLLVAARRRWGGLWAPLGIFAGWVGIGLVAGEPHQGLPVVAEGGGFGLPAILDGGAWGHEGGLACTLLLLAWLAWYARRRAVSDEPPAA